MKKRTYIANLLLAAIVLLTGCSESLEDTYSEYAGDGKIRYVAKCSELDVTPGWERLIVNWVNGTDATVDKIKVVWSCEDRRDSVLLPRETTEHVFRNMIDGTYRFDVCAMDKAGHESIRETDYERPYTRNHEAMLAFTRGVVKPYFLNNKMLFFADQWNENIVEMKLQYKTPEKETKIYDFTRSNYGRLVTIPGQVSMDPMDTVYVLRKGKLESSPDTVTFDPLPISRKKNFSAGFVQAVQRRYGYTTDTKEQEDEFLRFIETTKQLELDYDIETLEDILYCSSLKTLVVGKNRHFTNTTVFPHDVSKILKDPTQSKGLIYEASKPDILGLQVEYYGHNSRGNVHYFDNYNASYMMYKGYSEVSGDLQIIGEDELRTYDNGNKVQCTPEDPYADLDALVDDDPATRWETVTLQSMRTYEMYMELKDVTVIRGIKVAQVPVSSPTSKDMFFLPATINIQTSLDGSAWEDVTWLPVNDLGRAPGEVTLLPIAGKEPREVKYIRFTLRDGADNAGNWSIVLGDIVLYK